MDLFEAPKHRCTACHADASVENDFCGMCGHKVTHSETAKKGGLSGALRSLRLTLSPRSATSSEVPPTYDATGSKTSTSNSDARKGSESSSSSDDENVSRRSRLGAKLKQKLGKKKAEGTEAKPKGELIVASALFEAEKRPVICTVLEKRGDKGPIVTRMWKKRLFVLNEKTDELDYYEGTSYENPKNKKGTIYLPNATPSIVDLSEIHPLAFGIEVPGSLSTANTESSSEALASPKKSGGGSVSRARLYVLRAKDKEHFSAVTQQLNQVFQSLLKEATNRFLFGENYTAKPQVQAGSLDRLVERLTDGTPEPVDAEYSQTFLLTYRSFTTPMELLLLIKTRLKLARHSEKEEGFDWCARVRERCLSFLLAWVEAGYDFVEDPNMMKISERLVRKVLKEPDAYERAKQLERALEIKRNECKHSNYQMIAQIGPIYALQRKLAELSAPAWLWSDTKDELTEKFKSLPARPLQNVSNDLIFIVEPLEIARQLTMVQFEIFHAIMPRECFGQAWLKNTKETKVGAAAAVSNVAGSALHSAPNIVKLIERFNHTSRWVSTEIVMRNTAHDRAVVMQRLIQLAKCYRELNNFNGLQEIISGFENAAVMRLYATWDELEKMNADAYRLYDELKTLMAHQGSYRAMRAALHRAEPPSMPYLGTYLTDLVFISEGNKDVTPDGFVNFRKRTQIAQVLRVIQRHQTVPYCFSEFPALQKMLEKRAQACLDDKELYALSLQKEPRKPR